MNNQVLQIENASVEIYDVKCGYEIVIERDNGDNLIAYESPKDGLFEQLVEAGYINE